MLDGSPMTTVGDDGVGMYRGRTEWGWSPAITYRDATDSFLKPAFAIIAFA